MRLHSQLTLLIIGLLALQGHADEIEPLEPGQTTFTNVTTTTAPDGPPEPATKSEFTSAITTTQPPPPEPETSPSFTTLNETTTSTTTTTTTTTSTAPPFLNSTSGKPWYPMAIPDFNKSFQQANSDPPEPQTQPELTQTATSTTQAPPPEVKPQINGGLNQSDQALPEPGQQVLTSGQAPPEPGQQVLSSQTSGKAPPEPQTRPAFSTEQQVVAQTRPAASTSAQLNQAPPEPQSQPTFTGSSSNQGPPEPQSRPSFTDQTNLLQQQTRPAPSTTGQQNHVPPEPSITDQARAQTRPAPTERPSEVETRPFLSREFSRPVVQPEPEPQTRPYFGSSVQVRPSAEVPIPYYLSTPATFYSTPPPPAPPASPVQYRPRPASRSHDVETRPHVIPEPGQIRFQAAYSYVRPAPQIEDQAPIEPGNTFLQRQNGNFRYHHLEDHKPKLTDRYGRPFSQQVWKCDIPRNNCFLNNKVNFVPMENVPYFANNNEQALVVDVSKAARQWVALGKRRPNPVKAYNAARLESTGYFETKYVDACIALSYYWSGDRGRKYLHVLQRNQEDVCIYSDMLDPRDPNFSQKSGHWHDVQLQLDLRYGDAKFWIEWQFDIGDRHQDYPDLSQGRDFGYVAIRNFSIGYGQCQENWAQECDVPPT